MSKCADAVQGRYSIFVIRYSIFECIDYELIPQQVCKCLKSFNNRT